MTVLEKKKMKEDYIRLLRMYYPHTIRLTTAQAAKQLGIKVETLQKRLHRNYSDYFTKSDRWYVIEIEAMAELLIESGIIPIEPAKLSAEKILQGIENFSKSFKKLQLEKQPEWLQDESKRRGKKNQSNPYLKEGFFDINRLASVLRKPDLINQEGCPFKLDPAARVRLVIAKVNPELAEELDLFDLDET